MNNRALSVAVAVLGVAVAATGIWAFVDPGSFYQQLATYPPYNRHLVRDIGAFNIGLGSALLLGARFRGGLFVALAANTIAAVAHALSHIIDSDLGGRATDPWTMASLAAAFAALLYMVVKRERRPSR